VLRIADSLSVREKQAECPSAIPVSAASNSGRGERGSRQLSRRGALVGVGDEESQAVDEGKGRHPPRDRRGPHVSVAVDEGRGRHPRRDQYGLPASVGVDEGRGRHPQRDQYGAAGCEESKALDEERLEAAALELLELHTTLTALRGELNL
jgi:hypothetical protein